METSLPAFYERITFQDDLRSGERARNSLFIDSKPKQKAPVGRVNLPLRASSCRIYQAPKIQNLIVGKNST